MLFFICVENNEDIQNGLRNLKEKYIKILFISRRRRKGKGGKAGGYESYSPLTRSALQKSDLKSPKKSESKLMIKN